MNNAQKITRLSSKIHTQLLCRTRVSLAKPTTCSATPYIVPVSQYTLRPMSNLYQQKEVEKESYIKRAFKSIPFLGYNRNKLRLIALQQYEAMVSEIDYIKFFEELDLPDTFYSWFTVTELHLWMFATRAMAEGKEGRLLRNDIIGALWADVPQRVKKLGVSSYNSNTRAQIPELSEQLQATFIAYDEGIQAEDTVLAGALWRRFYQQEDIDLIHLEVLITYIRKNMRVLDSLTKEEFFDPNCIKWSPL